MSSLPIALIDGKMWTNCYLCGIQFASPILIDRRVDKRNFWCPNGHEQYWTGESNLAKAERLAKELAMSKSEVWNERSRADAAEARVRQFAAGKCPCCGQKFRRLREHMNKKHPRFKS